MIINECKMKCISVLLPAAFLMILTYSCKPGTYEENVVGDASYVLIPKPVQISYSPGHFTITEKTGIFCPSFLVETASLAAEQLGISKPVNTGRKRNGIFIQPASDVSNDFFGLHGWVE